MYTGSMKAVARAFCIGFLLISPLLSASAQGVPAVAVYSLASNDVGENVSKTVNDLVFSFIRELRNYRVIDLRAEATPRDLGVPDGADYIFYGNLVSQADGIKLELVLKGGPQRVTRLISRVYENSNLILLESRILVRDLFDTSVALPDAELPPTAQGTRSDSNPAPEKGSLGPVTDIDALAGSWRGESGVEKVMLLRGGRGVAVLSSGVSIPLELMLSDGTLVVRQKGPQNIRQFIDLPDPVARQAVSVAPPLEWYLMVSSDQKTLGGTKKTVRIKNDGKNILTMENVSIDVIWSRE
jgi:hypothetical protein